MLSWKKIAACGLQADRSDGSTCLWLSGGGGEGSVIYLLPLLLHRNSLNGLILGTQVTSIAIFDDVSDTFSAQCALLFTIV